jgi:hypothetical protein
VPLQEVVGGVALSDFDGDGDLDAFATIRGSFDQMTKIKVWRNNGDGTFTKITTGSVVNDGGNSAGGILGSILGQHTATVDPHRKTDLDGKQPPPKSSKCRGRERRRAYGKIPVRGRLVRQ